MTDDTKTKIANLKELQRHPGWLLVKEVVDENIDVLEKQILGGFEGETKEQIDRKRDKLKAYSEVINTPNWLIDRFESPDAVVETNDPY